MARARWSTREQYRSRLFKREHHSRLLTYERITLQSPKCTTVAYLQEDNTTITCLHKDNTITDFIRGHHQNRLYTRGQHQNRQHTRGQHSSRLPTKEHHQNRLSTRGQHQNCFSTRGQQYYSTNIIESPAHERTLQSLFSDRTTLQSPAHGETTLQSPAHGETTLQSPAHERTTLQSPAHGRTIDYQVGYETTLLLKEVGKLPWHYSITSPLSTTCSSQIVQKKNDIRHVTASKVQKDITHQKTVVKNYVLWYLHEARAWNPFPLAESQPVAIVKGIERRTFVSTGECTNHYTIATLWGWGWWEIVIFILKK